MNKESIVEQRTQQLQNSQTPSDAPVTEGHDESVEQIKHKGITPHEANLIARAREQSSPITSDRVLSLTLIVSVIYVFAQMSQPLPAQVPVYGGGGDEPQGDRLPRFSSSVINTLVWPREVLYTVLFILGAGSVLNQARNWYMRRQGAEDNLRNELPQYWEAQLQNNSLTKQQMQQLENDVALRKLLMRMDGPGGGLNIENLKKTAFMEALLSALIEKKKVGEFAAIAKFIYSTDGGNAPMMGHQSTVRRAQRANNRSNMSQGAEDSQRTSNNAFGTHVHSTTIEGTDQNWFTMLKNVLKGHTLPQGTIQLLKDPYSFTRFRAALEGLLEFLVQQHEDAHFGGGKETGLARFVKEVACDVPVIKQVLTADTLVDIADKLFFQTIESADSLDELMTAFVDMFEPERKHCAMQFLVRMSAQLDRRKGICNEWEKYIALFDRFRVKGFLKSWFDVKAPTEKGTLKDVCKRMANVFDESNNSDDLGGEAKRKFWLILTVLPLNNQILKVIDLPNPFVRSDGRVSLGADTDEVTFMCDALRHEDIGDRCLDATFNILAHTEDKAVRQKIVRAILHVENDVDLNGHDFPLSEKMKRVKEIAKMFKTVRADAGHLVRNIIEKEGSIFRRIVFLAYTQALAEKGLLNEEIEECCEMLESVYRPGTSGSSSVQRIIVNDFMCFLFDPNRRGGWDVLKEYFQHNKVENEDIVAFNFGFLSNAVVGDYPYRCYVLEKIASHNLNEFGCFLGGIKKFMLSGRPDVDALLGVYSFVSEDGLFPLNIKRNVIFDLRRGMSALLNSPETARSEVAQYGEDFYKEVLLPMDDDRLMKSCQIFPKTSDFVSVVIDAFLGGYLGEVSKETVYNCIKDLLPDNFGVKYSPDDLREKFKNKWVGALKHYLFLCSSHLVDQLSGSSSGHSLSLFSSSSSSSSPISSALTNQQSIMLNNIKSFIEDYIGRTPNKQQDFDEVFNPGVFDVMFPNPPTDASSKLIQYMMNDESPLLRNKMLKFLSQYRVGQSLYVEAVKCSLSLGEGDSLLKALIEKRIFDPAVFSFLSRKTVSFLSRKPDIPGFVAMDIGRSSSSSLEQKHTLRSRTSEQKHAYTIHTPLLSGLH